MFKLALRNIFRQKLHTAMTLAAIMGGVAGLTIAGGWVNDIFVQLSEALIHSQSGHLQIHKIGFFSAGSHAPEKYLIESPQAVKQRIASEREVSMVMARLNFSGLLNNGRTDLPIIGEGVEAKQEAALGSSISITQGRQLSDSDMFGVLVGHGVAEALNLEPGSHVTLLVNTLEGALNSMEFEVTGIFQSFSKDYDARAIRIPLAAAQELLGTDGVNTIVVLLQQTFLGPGGDGKATVEQVLKATEKAAGAPIKVTRFVRYALGEGIDKKDTDFAAEVAAAAGKR